MISLMFLCVLCYLTLVSNAEMSSSVKFSLFKMSSSSLKF